MPSYRVVLAVGALRPGVAPDRVIDLLAEPVAEWTTVEASSLEVVRAQPRVVIRFTGDDDLHARRVARATAAAAGSVVDLGEIGLLRRDGGRWTPVELDGLVDRPPVPVLLRHGYSAAQVRAAEKPLLARGEPLMQRAATGLAEVVGELVAGLAGSGDRGEVLVLAGPGNNGADAMWAASFLAADGIDVTVLTCASQVDPDSHRAAVEAGARSLDADKQDAVTIADLARGADVVVDGLFGNGAGGGARELTGTPGRVVAAMTGMVGPHGPLVVAADLPRGIGSDDGAVPDVILPADVTVTFGAAKAGLLLAPARWIAGEVVVVDIGLGEELEKVRPLVRASGR